MKGVVGVAHRSIRACCTPECDQAHEHGLVALVEDRATSPPSGIAVTRSTTRSRLFARSRHGPRWRVTHRLSGPQSPLLCIPRSPERDTVHGGNMQHDLVSKPPSLYMEVTSPFFSRGQNMNDDGCSMRGMRFFGGAIKVLKEFDSLPLATDQDDILMRRVLRRVLVNSFCAELISLHGSIDDSG
jgi:hypothetical protein